MAGAGRSRDYSRLCVKLVLLEGWLLEPPEETAGMVQPTIIVLTAPPSPTAAPTSSRLPPTPIPTFTPIPTPDTAVAPAEITTGFFATVANTDDLGLTVRGGPSTKNVVVVVADEGTTVLVLDGPVEAENFEWWQLRLDNGLEGWAVANFLEPSAEPELTPGAAGRASSLFVVYNVVDHSMLITLSTDPRNKENDSTRTHPTASR